MKTISLGLFLLSTIAAAMPNPQYIGLDNVAQLGAYIREHMTEIVDSSVMLAEKAMPHRHYFLITNKISINAFDTDAERGLKPFATIEMSSGDLQCKRTVFSTVKSNEWGESRVLTFTLSPTIDCK